MWVCIPSSICMGLQSGGGLWDGLRYEADAEIACGGYVAGFKLGGVFVGCW